MPVRALTHFLANFEKTIKGKVEQRKTRGSDFLSPNRLETLSERRWNLLSIISWLEWPLVHIYALGFITTTWESSLPAPRECSYVNATPPGMQLCEVGQNIPSSKFQILVRKTLKGRYLSHRQTAPEGLLAQAALGHSTHP